MLSEKLNMWGGENKTRGEFSFKCCREWIHFSLTSADSPDCSLIHEHFKLKWACRLSVGRLTLSFGKINSQMFSSGETSSVAIGHVKLSPVKFSVTCEQFNTEINLNSGLKISKCIKKKKKKKKIYKCVWWSGSNLWYSKSFSDPQTKTNQFDKLQSVNLKLPKWKPYDQPLYVFDKNPFFHFEIPHKCAEKVDVQLSHHHQKISLFSGFEDVKREVCWFVCLFGGWLVGWLVS